VATHEAGALHAPGYGGVAVVPGWLRPPGDVNQLLAPLWAASVDRGAQGSIEITVTELGAAQHDIPAMVAARHSGLSRLEAGEISLEEVFVELVGGER